MKMFKTKAEHYDDARRMRIEKIALWFVRWSQVLFFVGVVTIIIDCLYWTFTAINKLQGTICFVIAFTSVLFMLLGSVVYIKSLIVGRGE